MNYLQWGTSVSLSRNETLSGSEPNFLSIVETNAVQGSWNKSARASSKKCEYEYHLPP